MKKLVIQIVKKIFNRVFRKTSYSKPNSITIESIKEAKKKKDLKELNTDNYFNETSYLLNKENNKKKLMEGITQANEGKTKRINIADL